MSDPETEAPMTTTTLPMLVHDDVFTDPETIALAGFLAALPTPAR